MPPLNVSPDSLSRPVPHLLAERGRKDAQPQTGNPQHSESHSAPWTDRLPVAASRTYPRDFLRHVDTLDAVGGVPT